LFSCCDKIFIGNLWIGYKVEEGQYFKAIKDLAYGKYCYKVAQYDVNETLIAETDYIKFSLSAPPFMIDRPW